MKKDSPAGSVTSDRVDHWVGQRFPGLTRNQVLEAIEQGFVRAADGGRLRKGDAVSAGREPDCSALAAHLARIRAGNPELAIPVLLETPELVVVDKPAGIPGHPVHLADFATVSHWALHRYPEIRTWCADAQPAVTPHRLDTGTSGVLLVARTMAAFGRWRRHFSRGQVRKEYLAWCWGTPSWNTRMLNQPISHAPGDRGRMTVATQGVRARRHARPALSEVTILEQRKDRFLCELRLQTGVTHQVRVHMAAAGHPLVGDALYDTAFASRADQPEHALLRAVRVSCGEFDVCAPRAEFVALFRG